MKHITRTGRLVLLLLLLLQGFAYSQERSQYGWEMGLGIGYTNYYGDLSNYQIKGISDLYKGYRFADFNRYYVNQPSFSITFHKKLTPTLGLMFQANALQFGMSDRYRNKNGSLDTSSANYSRSLNFRTNLQDAGLAFTFNANNGKAFGENAFFYPSFYLGAGVSTFTVKGDLYDANGNQYNYRLPGTINDESFETNLRDLRTETNVRYKNVVPYVDLGLALNFRISSAFKIAIQTDIKYSASDYLDDVSRTYKTSYASPLEAYAARPGYNVVNPVTLQRGDNNGVNDFYINNRVLFSFALSGKPKTKSFNPPVIYSLGTYRPSKIADSSGRKALSRDSLMTLRMDSLLAVKTDSLRRRDSIAHAGNPAQDSLVRTELQSIRSELRDIKALVRDQQVRPRYTELQSQADSIRRLRSKVLAQRTISKEDNLRVRIYNLQVDSINSELQKLQYQAPGTIMDTARTYPGQQQGTRNSYMAQPGYDGNAATVPANQYQPVPDTLNSTDLQQWNSEVQDLKKDKRYKADAAFKKSVDSFQLKLNNYRNANNNARLSANSRAVNVENQSANPAYPSADYQRDQRRVDSLQQRLDELQRSANSQPAVPVADTGVYRQRQAAEDTSAYNQSIRDMQARVKANSDSLAHLQQQLKRSKDSAAYYQRIAFAQQAAVPPAPEPKKKWYQTIFQSKKKKQQQAAASQAAQSQLIGNRVNVDSIASVNRQMQYSQDSAAYFQRNTSAQQAAVQPAPEPKKKWYQTIFQSKKKKQQQAAAAQTAQLQVNRSQVNADSIAYANRRLQRSQDSALYYRQSTVPRDSTMLTAPAKKKKWYQTIFQSKKKKNQDQTNQQQASQQAAAYRPVNTDSIAYANRQLQQSRDALVYANQGAPLQPNAISDRPLTKKEKRALAKSKKNSQQQAETINGQAGNNLQQRNAYAQQQQYYDEQNRRLQADLDDLQRRNKALVEEYNNVLASGVSQRRNSVYAPPPVVYQRDYVGDNTTRRTTETSELAALRTEMERLRSQVNSNTANGLQTVPTSNVAVAPPAATVPADTSHISALRSEIDLLRSQLDSMRSPKPQEAKPQAADKPVFDVTSFPVLSVYFNLGSTVLSSDQVNKIAPLARAAAKNTEAGILLKGFTDPTGNATLNNTISRKRTEYVKNLLSSRYKIDAGRISVDEPVQGGSGTGKANPLDRRVDIQFQ